MEFPCRAFLCACGGRYSPPPHAWGILPYLASRYVRGRFIPTCVGNTTPISTIFSNNSGSSPRAWGIPGQNGGRFSIRRFIPTCVGNTVLCGVCCRRRPVHPHMRGEYPHGPPWAGHLDGSSPHAWGILVGFEHIQAVIRFIPTCVGNTWCISQPASRLPVHPHMRGEYS